MIAVIGAAGRSGAALCRALAEAGRDYIAVVRNAEKWRALGLPGEMRVAALEDAPALHAALAGATRVVSCAHARYAAAIIVAAPLDASFVFMGSTRRFSRWPDFHGDGVRAGEAALLGSGRQGVILHPTMIYGAQGEDNVQRLAALVRKLPIAPLPGGGRALVQPIHQSDVSRSLFAAVTRDWPETRAIVIAGPEPVAYRDFLAAVARAAGVRVPPVVSVPGWLLRALAPLTQVLPRLPRIGADEVRRLLEDKDFDIGPMRAELGVTPIPLTEGLALTFASRET